MGEDQAHRATKGGGQYRQPEGRNPLANGTFQLQSEELISFGSEFHG
jgi:hypothetical protein